MQLFQSAIKRPPEERAPFLNEVCAGDPSLRSEVESLISSREQAVDTIETVAVNVATQVFADKRAEPLVGQQIGPYKVISFIGRGGMGEVYLAQDTRLARRVALKLSPSHFTQDKQRLEHFRREARAASALNHPNILTIYEIGEAEGSPFIAAEFIDGETLRSRIADSQINLGEALEVAIQVASAIAEAHAAGIVHRDIKPENIMIRHDGYVKVLDFGLAKLAEPPESTIDTQGPTMAEISTESELVIGTPQYMSPEQARGQKVDARTDIFSLGVVLYEMVAGRKPFEGSTVSDVIVSVLEHEPQPLWLDRQVGSDELERIVTKALRKDRQERYQTIKEMLVDLKRLKQENDACLSGAPASRAMKRHSTLTLQGMLTLAILVALIVVAAYVLLFRGGPRSDRDQVAYSAAPREPLRRPGAETFRGRLDASGKLDCYIANHDIAITTIL